MACDTIKIETLDADEVVSIVTAGPQGPSGAEAATLTTTGDLLYRAALANARLPIGSEGQILKVSSGIPAWGNESGAVTSVNGETGAVVLDAADVGAAPATGISPSAITGTAVVDSDARLSDSRSPTAHKNSHSIGQADFLAPSDIGAQSIFVTEDLGTITADATLTAARAKIYLVNSQTSGLSINLPTTNIMAGDVVQIRFTSFNGQTVAVKRDGSFYGNSIRNGQQVTYIAASTAANSWEEAGNNRMRAGTIETAGGPVVIGRSSAGAGVCVELGIGTGASEIAAGDHGHGNINSSGLVGTVANLPLKTGTGGIVEAGAFGTNAGEFAEGNHTHTQLHDKSHTMTDATSHTAGNHKVFYSDGSGQIQELALGNSGEVLTSNGASAAPSFAAASGGVTAVGASTADVLSVSGSDLIADDGGTIDSSDPFIKWDDTAGKLVYANPLSRPSGAFYVGLAPTTTAIGTNSVNIQPSRSNANQVAEDTNGVVIGINARAHGGTGSQVVIGATARAQFARGVAIGNSSFAQEDATALGNSTSASQSSCVAIGNTASSSAPQAVAIGRTAAASGDLSLALGSAATASALWSTACGTTITANLRGQFMTRPFGSVFWGGQTTNDTATVLNLDATATNRFTIAANTALAVDILLVARRSDVADKWLVARRFLGIRRDGSNNTSLIGSVQTLGTDQSAGSPTWSFTLTADDTNEALQLEVTGAASETVQWRATAFYRVV